MGGEPLRRHSLPKSNRSHVARVTSKVMIPEWLTTLAAISINRLRTVVGYAERGITPAATSILKHSNKKKAINIVWKKAAFL